MRTPYYDLEIFAEEYYFSNSENHLIFFVVDGTAGTVDAPLPMQKIKDNRASSIGLALGKMVAKEIVEEDRECRVSLKSIEYVVCTRETSKEDPIGRIKTTVRRPLSDFEKAEFYRGFTKAMADKYTEEHFTGFGKKKKQFLPNLKYLST